MREEMILTAETKVSAIAAAYPATLRMMEALGIDYCCGGKLPLAAAAEKAHVPVVTVMAVLQTAIAQAGVATGERDWQDAPLGELMAHIVHTHHGYLQRELPRMDEMMQKVVRAHGAHHGDVLEPLARHFSALKAELTAHLAKEEEITFPAIARVAAGEGEDALATIAELTEEHEAAGAVLAAMREDTHNYALPADACNTFRGLYMGLQELEQDIHQHIHLENNILFPRIRAQAQRGQCAA